MAEIEDCVKSIISTLEDNNGYKKSLLIALENHLFDIGQRPCNGVWDRSQGKCIVNVPPPPPPTGGFTVNAGGDQNIKVSSFPTSVSLMGQIRGWVSIKTFKWEGLPNIPKSLNPTVTIPDAGTYTLTLTATDVKGNTNFDSVNIFAEKIIIDPEPTTKVKILVFADNDSTPDSENVLSAMMNEPNVSQYLFVGDGPYSKTGTVWVNMMRKYFDDVKVKLLMLSRGNHDTKSSESIQTQRDIEAWIPSLKRPDDNWLTSKRVGNTFIISMDSEDLDIEFKRDQYNWVMQQLEVAKTLKASGQIDWIIVMTHKPWFTLKSTASPYTAVRQIYSLIFKQYGVDFVVSGHNHNQQLWFPMIAVPSEPGNGIGQQLFTKTPDGAFDFSKDGEHGALYIVSGIAGHEFNKINDSGPGVKNVIWYTDDVFSYTSIEIEAKKAHVMAKDTQGKVLYEYFVVK